MKHLPTVLFLNTLLKNKHPRLAFVFQKTIQPPINCFVSHVKPARRTVDRGGLSSRSKPTRRRHDTCDLACGNLLNQMKFCFYIFIIIFAVALCPPVLAMDRYCALSMLESGDNDNAVGSHQEVSRFQILPAVWREYASPESNPTISAHAILVAESIMRARSERFTTTHHREPTPFEFYLLWNCPANVLNPSAHESERARRFANLCEKQ